MPLLKHKVQCPWCDHYVTVPETIGIVMFCHGHGGKCQYTVYCLVPIETGDMRDEQKALNQMYLVLTLGEYKSPSDDGAPQCQYLRRDFVLADGLVTREPRDFTNLQGVTFMRLSGTEL